jgi:hypothetical protein
MLLGSARPGDAATSHHDLTDRAINRAETIAASLQIREQRLVWLRRGRINVRVVRILGDTKPHVGAIPIFVLALKTSKSS